MKSNPTGKSTISVLSLLSDRELIDVSAHRKSVIESPPKVTEFEEVAAAACAFHPSIKFCAPVVRSPPALLPTAVFCAPVVLADKAP